MWEETLFSRHLQLGKRFVMSYKNCIEIDIYYLLVLAFQRLHNGMGWTNNETNWKHGQGVWKLTKTETQSLGMKVNPKNISTTKSQKWFLGCPKFQNIF